MIKLNQLTACCVVFFNTQHSAVTKHKQNLQEIAINQEEKMKKLIAAALTLVLLIACVFTLVACSET